MGIVFMAGVQLLHSLIYLKRFDQQWYEGWGSTLTLPDILDFMDAERKAVLGFNSYTP